MSTFKRLNPSCLGHLKPAALVPGTVQGSLLSAAGTALLRSVQDHDKNPPRTRPPTDLTTFQSKGKKCALLLPLPVTMSAGCTPISTSIRTKHYTTKHNILSWENEWANQLCHLLGTLTAYHCKICSHPLDKYNIQPYYRWLYSKITT